MTAAPANGSQNRSQGREPEFTTRFWEVPVPLLAVHRCAGQPMLLAAWLNIADAEREDLALGQPPRSRSALAASMGMDEVSWQRVVDSLLAAGLVTSNADGTLQVPWTPLYFASLAYARQQQQQNVATRAAAAASSAASAHQEPLAFE